MNELYFHLSLKTDGDDTLDWNYIIVLVIVYFFVTFTKESMVSTANGSFL